MANAHFDLRDYKAKTPQIIYLRYKINQNEALKFSTGLKVLPKWWDKEKERIKNTIEIKDRQAMNAFLSELAGVVESFKVEKRTNKEIETLEDLRHYLTEYLTPTNSNEKTLFGFLEIYIEKLKSRVNEQTGRALSKTTHRKMAQLKDDLTAFQKVYKRMIDFKTIDLDFYTDFTAYLQKKKLAVNTIGTKIKALKTLLNEATEKGVNTNLAYKSKRFTAISEEIDSVYLTEAEIKKISKLDLSENQRLERVRDIFLTLAHTGLRYSDYKRLTKGNVQNGFITIHQKKVGTKVIIPIHAIVSGIMKRNGGTFVPALSDQKMNEYVKELCKEAGIKDIVSDTITKGGKQITANREKWEMVGTHTGRRTFATNQFLAGVQTQTIMKITGHSTEKEFLKYIKVTREESAKLLQLHWDKTNTKMEIA